MGNGMTQDLEWQFFVPDDWDETAEDAHPIEHWEHQTIHCGSTAAEMAAEQLWNSHDGWEWMMNKTVRIGVVHRGAMRLYDVSVEPSVSYYARAVEDVE